MSYQVLARKWRPRVFADLVGQEHIVRALSNALTDNRLHHAYLLTGTRGVGKTTIARILAKSLNCEQGVTATPCGECAACRQIDAGRFVDLLEIDAASNTGIDNIREVIENAQYAPTAGRFKVYIIDEVHMLSKPAFNAMLKTLEEPPSHVKFILATTDPQKVPVTILSRCLQFSLRNMTPQQIAGHLERVLNTEGIPFEVTALALLGRAASGSMRDALSLLDQAIAYGVGQVEESGVRAMLGAVDRRHLFALLAALADGDGKMLLAEAAQLAAHGAGFDAVLGEMATVLYDITLAQTVPEALDPEDPDRETLLALANTMTPEDVQLYYQIALTGKRDLGLAPDEHLGFNMTLLRMLAFHPLHSPSLPAPTTSAPAVAAPRSMVAEQSLSSPLPPPQPAGGARAVLNKILEKRVSPQLASPPEPPPPPPPPWEDELPPPAVEPLFEAEEMRPAPSVAVSEPAPVFTPAAAPESEPAPPSAVTAASVFSGDWLGLVETLKPRLGAARVLAQNAELLALTNGVFHLRVPQGFFDLASAQRDKFAALLSEYFAQPFSVQLEQGALQQENHFAQQARQKRERIETARAILESDPVIQALAQNFAASLVLDSIQPQQE